MQMRLHTVDTLPPPTTSAPDAAAGEEPSGTAEKASADAKDAAPAKDAQVCPKTPIAFDIMQRGDLMATSQLGDEGHTIRIARKPEAL
jgi:hypothetical protein